MKFSLHVTILVVLLTLTIVLTFVLGVTSYVTARNTAWNLTKQVLTQTSERIEDELRDMLISASNQVRLTRRLLETGRFQRGDGSQMIALYLEEMQVRPELCRVSLALERTGEWLFVRRTDDNRLAVGTLRATDEPDLRELRSFWSEDYPNNPFLVHRTKQDPRERVWYQGARDAGQQIWTDAYMLIGVHGVPVEPGISCAAPVYHPDGTLATVVEGSINLNYLCRFLRDVPVSANGIAFVLELRPDGSRRLIGHPDPTNVFRTARVEGDSVIKEFVPLSEAPDQRVFEMLKLLPDEPPEESGAVSHRTYRCEGKNYIGGYQRLRHGEGPDCLVCILVPDMDVMGALYRNNAVLGLLGLTVLLIGILASFVIAGHVSRPLEALVAEAESIGRFNVDPTPRIESFVKEVDRLTLATEAMKSSLRSFRKFVPADLVHDLLRRGVEARLGGSERPITIFFCDIAGFTSISEQQPPQQLVEQLGEYFRAFTEEVVATGGTVDKFIGDAVMAFWNAPNDLPEHALAACKTALACQKRLAELRVQWEKAGLPQFHARIGINTGLAVVGNIGSEQRLNYTAIGDSVNIASRLEGLNKYYHTSIMLSDATRDAAGDAIVARPLDWVSVKGKNTPMQIYELIGLAGEVSDEEHHHCCCFHQALGHYRSRNWSEAISQFEKILTVRPNDGPTKEMLCRCRLYQESPPSEAWDGVHRMESK